MEKSWKMQMETGNWKRVGGGEKGGEKRVKWREVIFVRVKEELVYNFSSSVLWQAFCLLLFSVPFLPFSPLFGVLYLFCVHTLLPTFFYVSSSPYLHYHTLCHSPTFIRYCLSQPPCLSLHKLYSWLNILCVLVRECPRLAAVLKEGMLM